MNLNAGFGAAFHASLVLKEFESAHDMLNVIGLTGASGNTV